MRPPAIDDNNRYTGLDRFGRVDDQWYLNTSTSATVDRLQYGYDRDSNVLYQNNLVNAAFSELYHANSATTGDNNSAYDPLNRITSFRRGTLTSSTNNGTGLDTITTANLNSTTGVPNQNSWSLDALGNWTSGAGVSNTFNSQNEETSNGSNTLTYDHNGDMTTDQAGNLYTFDAWGHVIRIANSSNSTEETFSYDALGRAVVNNNGSGTENRYYSGGNIIQEQFSSTNYAQYVYGLAYVNDVILRDRNADGNNSTGNLGITGSGLEEREYAQHDTQFSTISLTDSAGAVMQRFVYDPYGAITVLTPTWTVDGTGGGTNYWLYTFQGMRIVDAPGTSGMLFSETRIYNAALGRWGSQDPWHYVNGLNVYQFEGDSPENWVDPLGTAIWKDTGNGIRVRCDNGKITGVSYTFDKDTHFDFGGTSVDFIAHSGVALEWNDNIVALEFGPTPVGIDPNLSGLGWFKVAPWNYFELNSIAFNNDGSLSSINGTMKNVIFWPTSKQLQSALQSNLKKYQMPIASAISDLRTLASLADTCGICN